METDGVRELMTAAEVAKVFRVDPKTLNRWVKTGAFPAPVRTPGGHRRWYADQIRPIAVTSLTP